MVCEFFFFLNAEAGKVSPCVTGVRRCSFPILAKAPPMEADPAIPALRDSNAMHVAPPYYPEGALAARAHGICKLHVTVSGAGDVDALDITQSTGSVELDQACLDTIYDAPFIPGRREGKFVSGTTDVVLNWRLPVAATP